MIMETPDNARSLSSTRRRPVLQSFRKDAERIRSRRKKDKEKKDNQEDIERSRRIKELAELHYDGTLDTLEELAEKLSELIGRPATITKDPQWWGNDWYDSYTASYELTVGKKKRVVGFLRFADAEVVRKERRDKKNKQDKKERLKQRKLDRARDASYCLTCHQSLD